MKITIDKAVLEHALSAILNAVPQTASQAKEQLESLLVLREALAQPQPEPAWWPAVENILNEYGLQAIDFVADFKAALAQPQPEPVAIHQWRKPMCCNWYDGHPDPSDGGGPYETRVLYTSPPAQRQPLTAGDRDKVFDRADKRMQSNTNTSWRNAIVDEVEAAHGIKEMP